MQAEIAEKAAKAQEIIEKANQKFISKDKSSWVPNGYDKVLSRMKKHLEKKSINEVPGMATPHQLKKAA